MGLFSGLKKAVGGIFKGVSKIFKPVTKLVQKGLSKIVGKKWARRLTMGAAIFMGGTALIAGFQGFMGASGGFFSKLVTGGKEFLAALAHPIKGAKSILPGGGSLTGAGGAATSAAGTAAVSAPAAAPAAAVTEGLPAAISAPELGALPGTTLPAGTSAAGGLLSKAGAGIKSAGGTIFDFAKTPGGGLLIGNTLAGMGEASAQKSLEKYRDRNNVPFTAEQMALMNRTPAVPSGYLSRAQQIMSLLNGRPMGSAPVPIGTPEYVASLARGGN
jgi:hypothetical protein